jgi:hypothetical protein
MLLGEGGLSATSAGGDRWVYAVAISKGKSKKLVEETYSSEHRLTPINLTSSRQELNPKLRCKKQASSRLSYGKAPHTQMGKLFII